MLQSIVYHDVRLAKITEKTLSTTKKIYNFLKLRKPTTMEALNVNKKKKTTLKITLGKISECSYVLFNFFYEKNSGK